MIDYSALQMSIAASSNKLIQEGTGSISIPAIVGSGEEFRTATIPHNQGHDNLLFQVGVALDINNDAVIPWQSNDGRIIAFASIDATNLYITINSNTLAGAPSFLFPYSYRILIP